MLADKGLPALSQVQYGVVGLTEGEHLSRGHAEQRADDQAEDGGATVWHLAAADSEWFSPSQSPFMINYRVDDLDTLVANMREAGVTIVGEPETHDNGKFAWVMDPDGNKIELWQPTPRDIAIADTFSVSAGCDKQFGTCREKFSNGVNFRGFPHMPGNDFSVSYPNRGDAANDGGSLN